MGPRTVAVVVTFYLLPGAARAIADQAHRRYVETHGGGRQVVEYGVARSADGFLVSSIGETSIERGRWLTGTTFEDLRN